MLSSGNIQYFFHFIWSTKNVNTCSQPFIMWGLQHLWSPSLEIYLVISHSVHPVFLNKAEAENFLIFQLSSSQGISTWLRFYQSDATSREWKSEVSIMGRQLHSEDSSSNECGAYSSWFLVGDGVRALDSKSCGAPRKARWWKLFLAM